MASVIPTNRAAFDLDQIVEVTRGKLAARGTRSSSVGVSTDTRTIIDGNLFVALKGERFDGHDHVAAAIAKGACVVVVSKVADDLAVYGQASVVEVPDTLEALGLLGRAHVRRWRAARDLSSTPIVAVAGSAGKTTTRRAIATALRGVGRTVHAPVGNLNNLVGIPMVLLSLEPHHNAVVVEVGTNAPGEVRWGAGLVEPNVSVLTLIAREHTEGLGDLDSIAFEEGHVLESLAPLSDLTSTLALVNGDDARCTSFEMRPRAPTSSAWMTYGESEKADCRVLARHSLGLDGNVLVIDVKRGEESSERIEVKTPLLGRAGALATSAAVAVASRFVPAGQLSGEALSKAFDVLREEKEGGRLAPITLSNGAVLIDDSYNANRVSAESSITVARELAIQLKRKLVLVLGEMRELGVFSAEEHDGVGSAVVAARPEALVAVEGDAMRIHQIASTAALTSYFEPTAVDAIARVRELAAPNVLILFKGSRGVGLDKIVSALSQPSPSSQGAPP
ncbi:MAG: UDP-N-acetylmuramoyl-tripeptide--D-alanyl-D-alanine ligase [Polyangiaceae bacterium]